MKNRLILFILFITANIVHAQNTTPNKFNSKEKVGYIKFDKKRDNPKFHLCDEFNIMEYYQVNPKYGEGYKSIRLYFDQYLKEIEKQIMLSQQGLIESSPYFELPYQIYPSDIEELKKKLLHLKNEIIKKPL